MRINKDSLKARVNRISKELSIPANVVYDRFFFDAFLSRLAVSPFNDRFILKGGLYLSNVFGVDTRSTMDMDFYIKKLKMEEESVIETVTQIAGLDLNDNISFRVIGTEGIRPEDPYGGFRVKAVGRLENVRYEFGVDIATGDPIVPSERKYGYKCLITGDTLLINAYSLESVIAEKLETVLARQFANSRSKDYYDLCVLRKTRMDEVDLSLLKKAFKQTCEYRRFAITKNDALALIEEIGVNSQIKSRWFAYTRRNAYAHGMIWKDVIKSIIEWVNDIFY